MLPIPVPVAEAGMMSPAECCLDTLAPVPGGMMPAASRPVLPVPSGRRRTTCSILVASSPPRQIFLLSARCLNRRRLLPAISADLADLGPCRASVSAWRKGPYGCRPGCGSSRRPRQVAVHALRHRSNITAALAQPAASSRHTEQAGGGGRCGRQAQSRRRRREDDVPAARWAPALVAGRQGVSGNIVHSDRFGGPAWCHADACADGQRAGRSVGTPAGLTAPKPRDRLTGARCFQDLLAVMTADRNSSPGSSSVPARPAPAALARRRRGSSLT